MAKGKDERLSGARRKIQAAMEQAEHDHRLKLLRHRIELANMGVRSYEAHKITDAVRSFQSYLRILEDWKGVREGSLSPGLFEKKEDVAELLLISGVYWDLAKMFDKTTSAEKQKDFHHYLEKFVIFTKGQPFQALCAETLRRYIATNKPTHMLAFKNAYKVIQTTNCFIATSLVDVTKVETLPRLRGFRDETLLGCRSGQSFVRWYYRYGPAIARVVDRAPITARKALALILDGVAWSVK